jgi:ParB-like chromosome segregation protein Spo0J
MNTSFNIIIKPLSERIAQIATEVSSTTLSHRFYEYRDDTSDLPVIRIPISTPVYRVANYRTNLLQLRWIREKGTDLSFFSKGEENESVQRIQHAFLWDLANSEKESLTSIVYTLKKEGQRLPLLISSSGIVVNGNRRLAAMRELFAESSEDYSNFAYVDCMVLPSVANEDDLKDIEVKLQMTPETRLPYGWINECIAIKDLQQRGRTLEYIGQLMRLEAPRVKDKLLMLDEIDLYLQDWKNNLDYDALNDAEEIIGQITARLRKKEGTQKEISRRIGWILLEQRGKDGRVYDLREATGNLSEAVANKLYEEYTAEIASNTDNDEPLDLDFDFDESPSTDQALITFLESSKDDEQKQADIVNICRIVIEAKRNQNIGNSALKSVKDAHTKLIEVDLSTADTSTYNAIMSQLTAITSKVQFLNNELNKYINK